VTDRARLDQPGIAARRWYAAPVEERDRWEIEALMNEYAYTLDRGDFELHAELFADAEKTIIDPWTGAQLSQTRGADETLKRLRETIHTYENGGLRTGHVTSNITVTVDASRATASAQSYITLFQGIPGRLPLRAIFLGRYEDRFMRREGAWRFTQRKIFADFIGDIGMHSGGLSPAGDA
jgi:3-phenylpropionate/cinnamic acid dioxygenase small subunit